MTESLHALSGAYVVDALDDHERTMFEEHLPTCRDCQAEVASLREAAAVMADAVAVTPPPELRSSIMAGISQIRPLPPETDPSTASNVVSLHSRRRRVTRWVAAAAAVVAIGTGAVWQPWEQSTSQSPNLSAADRVLAASDVQKVAMDFADGSTATVYRSVSEGHAVLMTTKMAAPPSGKAYELWLRDKGGNMAPAGMMKTAGDHKVLLDGDASKATGVGITVEPEQGSEQPTSQPIALFELGKTTA